MSASSSGQGSLVKGPRWLTAHALAVFAFLYLPIAILILYSFNGQEASRPATSHSTGIASYSTMAPSGIRS